MRMTVASKDERQRNFVPERLDIPGRPELSPFLTVVSFSRCRSVGDDTILERATYEPDLKSFSNKGAVFRMTYRNTLGGSGRLIVRYDFLNEEYRAEKFVDGRSVGRIENRRWAAFLPVSIPAPMQYKAPA